MKKYEELKAKQSLTIDESNQVEAYEKAQLEKDEAYQEKQKLKKVISDSKYLTEEHKTALTNEVEGATLYDLIEVLPNKISTAEANDKKAFMKQLDTLKEPIRKTIYESKLDETVKNNLFSRLAAADSKDKIDALKTAPCMTGRSSCGKGGFALRVVCCPFRATRACRAASERATAQRSA